MFVLFLLASVVSEKEKWNTFILFHISSKPEFEIKKFYQILHFSRSIM